MGLFDFIILLIIAGIAGAIGQFLVGFSRTGCLGSIALGFIGALIGVWLARQVHLPELLNIHIGDAEFPVVWSIIGSALFVAVLGLLTRGRRQKEERRGSLSWVRLADIRREHVLEAGFVR